MMIVEQVRSDTNGERRYPSRRADRDCTKKISEAVRRWKIRRKRIDQEHRKMKPKRQLAPAPSIRQTSASRAMSTKEKTQESRDKDDGRHERTSARTESRQSAARSQSEPRPPPRSPVAVDSSW
ncbi:hypothetical protein FA95DRAFT_1563532 [Auriscalpium vulgare]|uniref:Uncharacterized protein n=1 Tax=Auriscalpium vulgare TaxID=40419 RepID=A0ACB8RIA6_9AGAM|nr:hypothetical protein FA95DRAFT_1563532 [Auriscalpium vulgare]